MTRLERLNAKQNENRWALDRACAKRDKAISDLGKAALAIKKAQQALARTEKLRVVAKKEARAGRIIPKGLNDEIGF